MSKKETVSARGEGAETTPVPIDPEAAATAVAVRLGKSSLVYYSSRLSPHLAICAAVYPKKIAGIATLYMSFLSMVLTPWSRIIDAA